MFLMMSYSQVVFSSDLQNPEEIDLDSRKVFQLEAQEDSDNGTIRKGPQYSTVITSGSADKYSGFIKHGVLVGEEASIVSSIDSGESGQLLVGSTDSNPLFVTPTAGNGLSLISNEKTIQYSLSSPVAVSNGGIGLTTLTAYALLAGGTTSTAAAQSLSSGNSGDVLISNGPTALPSWSSPLLQTVSVTLTNSQVRNLGVTPIILIPAPGDGKVISVLNCFVKFSCPSLIKFTGGGDLKLGYSMLSAQELIMIALSNSSLSSSSNQLSRNYPDNDNGDSYTNSVNLPVIIYKSSSSILGGNSSNDNTVTVILNYQILTI